MDDLYANLSSEILEVRDLGERLVVVFVIRSDAKGSGVAGEETLAQVVTVREGKIVQVRDYLSPEEALEAVGLSEQDAQADS